MQVFCASKVGAGKVGTFDSHDSEIDTPAEFSSMDTWETVKTPRSRRRRRDLVTLFLTRLTVRLRLLRAVCRPYSGTQQSPSSRQPAHCRAVGGEEVSRVEGRCALLLTVTVPSEQLAATEAVIRV
jgi:hypothetical protein